MHLIEGVRLIHVWGPLNTGLTVVTYYKLNAISQTVANNALKAFFFQVVSSLEILFLIPDSLHIELTVIPRGIEVP